MSHDWYEYSSMYTMIDKASLSHRYSKLVIGVYSTAVLLYSIATIDFRKPINNDCRQLLIKMELPFVFCESPIYEIVVCVQFVHLMAVASTIGMLDALIVTLVSYQQYLWSFLLCCLYFTIRDFFNVIFFQLWWDKTQTLGGLIRRCLHDKFR